MISMHFTPLLQLLFLMSELEVRTGLPVDENTGEIEAPIICDEPPLGPSRAPPADESQLAALWGTEPTLFVVIEGSEGPIRVPAIPMEKLGADW